jgi:hypothetical protein
MEDELEVLDKAIQLMKSRGYMVCAGYISEDFRVGQFAEAPKRTVSFRLTKDISAERGNPYTNLECFK